MRAQAGLSSTTLFKASDLRQEHTRTDCFFRESRPQAVTAHMISHLIFASPSDSKGPKIVRWKYNAHKTFFAIFATQCEIVWRFRRICTNEKGSAGSIQCEFKFPSQRRENATQRNTAELRVKVLEGVGACMLR